MTRQLCIAQHLFNTQGQQRISQTSSIVAGMDAPRRRSRVEQNAVNHGDIDSACAHCLRVNPCPDPHGLPHTWIIRGAGQGSVIICPDCAAGTRR